MSVKYASDETYNGLVSKGTVLADFFSRTCGPCKMLAKVLERLDEELPAVSIVKVDVESCPETAEKFNIRGVPDLYYYRDGELLFRETGAVDLDHIKKRLSEILH